MGKKKRMRRAGWLACADPQPMLEFLRTASGRKLRLFVVACCRRIWPVLTDERCREAVELAEQSADYSVSYKDLDSASAEAEAAFEDAVTTDGESDTWDEVGASAAHTASYASNPDFRYEDAVEVAPAAADASPAGVPAEKAAQAGLLRDLFGNPFRPATLAPSWLTPDVLTLARAAYQERHLPSGNLDPARLSVLADALEDAGCADAGLLGHLRSEGPHVRGCWGLDLVLGKS